MKQGVPQDFAPRGAEQMGAQHTTGAQHQVQRYKAKKSKAGDGHGGLHGLQLVAAADDAVGRPAHTGDDEHHIAYPYRAAFKCMQQAAAADQQIAAQDHGQTQQPVAVQPFAKYEHRQQAGPQRQAARQQHRAVRCRGKKESAVGQHCVTEAAEEAGENGDAPGQRGKAAERTRHCPRAALALHRPPAPGQQNKAGTHDARPGDIQRQQLMPGRSAGYDDKGRPDRHRDHSRQPAGVARRATEQLFHERLHTGIIRAGLIMPV